MQPMPNDNVFDFPSLGSSSGTLKPGLKSAEVADLQRSLQRLGFVGIKADGIYDDALAQVVRLVQRALVRPETGEADSFIDASITRAVDSPQSMEALRIGVVAREWSQKQGAALMQQPQQVQVMRDDQPFYAKPGFWLAAASAMGLYFLLKRADEPVAPILMGTDDPDDGVEDPEEFLAGHEPAKPRKKRKRKAKKKADLAALTDGEPPEPEVLDADDDLPEDAVDVTPGEGEPAAAPDAPPAAAASPGVSEAPKKRKRRRQKRDASGHFVPRGRSLADALNDEPPKRKKPKKRRKSRALAESAVGPDDEILGEAGDPDDMMDIDEA